MLTIWTRPDEIMTTNAAFGMFDSNQKETDKLGLKNKIIVRKRLEKWN